jgi:hypothetical protein
MKQVLILSSLILSFLFSFSQNIISVKFDSDSNKIVTVKKELVLFDSVSNTKLVFRPVFEYDEGSEFYNRKPSYTFIGFEMEQHSKYVTSNITFLNISYDTKTPSYNTLFRTYKRGYGDKKFFYDHDDYFNLAVSILNTPIKMIMFRNENKEYIIKLKNDSEKRYFVELYKELKDNGFYYRKRMEQFKTDDYGCITHVLKKTDDGIFMYVPTNLHRHHSRR